MTSLSLEVTRDAFLGGQVTLTQPKAGHRAGIDAVLLAATILHAETEHAPKTLLDVGCGPATIGLLAAHRLKNLHVTGVEIEQQLVDLARKNAADNQLGARVKTIHADICQPFQALQELGFTANFYDHVISNPPFYDEDHCRISDNNMKRRANSIASGGLEKWFKFMTTSTRADGQISLIYPADRLDDLIALAAGRFGALEIFPIFPRSGDAAIRIIIRGRKGSRAPLKIYRGLIMHDEDGSFTGAAKDILNNGSPLDFRRV